MDDFLGYAVGFARLLRGVGLNVPTDRVLAFASALGVIGVASQQSVYLSARATLISRPEDFPILDRCFSRWWLQQEAMDPGVAASEIKVAVELDADNDDAPEQLAEDGDEFIPDISIKLRFSKNETLRDKDFAKCTPQELEEAARAMERIALIVPERKSNRRISSRSRRGPLDLRRSARDAMSNQGEPVKLIHFEKGSRPRRIVLLCDISGSMEPYARAMIRFLHTAVIGGIRVEAFTFGTHLTRVTRELNWKDPDVALARAGVAVKDWSGGTRIGEAIGQFNDQFGIRGMARRSVVVVMSDGWDRGDPEILSREMARLSRVTDKIIWVNPLKYTPGYAPLARGMAAALPYIDNFIEGHSLGSLEKLAEVIAK